MPRRIRTLLLSTLYPSSARPAHGIFVETRLRELLRTGKVQTKVIAPVPWFPSTHARWGDYARMAATPMGETRGGVDVRYPRFALLPKLGMSAAPFSLARSALAAIRDVVGGGYEFDLIDAHYFYPDGVAAVMVGQALGKPVVITARGTDINLIPRHWLPRRLILGAARKSAAMVTVCRALKDELVALGACEAKITVLRNGVDLDLFQPTDRAAARERWGMSERYALASVGHLIARKGHDLAIRSLAAMPDAELHIVGAGEELGPLCRLSAAAGVAERVRFHGTLPQAALSELYGAADCLVLASSREGWANVLLEAMSCGTPVVASNVWGTPEVVASPEAGELMDERSAAGIARAVSRLRGRAVDRAATRAYAERFSWKDTSAGQIELFESVLSAAAPVATGA